MDDQDRDASTTGAEFGGRVLDGPALRALAHPLRFQLVELLIEHGPSTASGLARLVGESSGLTSYHLRELAKHELVEEAPELGTGRDRYWRPVEGGYTFTGFDLLEGDDTRADARFYLDEVLRVRQERTRRWREDSRRWGEAWDDAAADMTARLRLTRDELAALTAELTAVLQRYIELEEGRDLPGAEHPGAVTVAVHFEAFPTGEPPSG